MERRCGGESESRLVDIEYVKQILENITDTDSNFIGFSSQWCRPEWLICSVLPVPPPSVRPSVKQDNSQRMDDDLTHKLSDIIKTNNNLKKTIDNNSSRKQTVNDLTKVLQYHVATMIDNDISGISQSALRSGRSLKSIMQRLKGKEGRIRNNLMGKRVDYSARSVITPDPNLELDELGVPIKIATNLTFPEIVNDFNKKKLEDYIKNGDNFPGVKSIIKKDSGKKITVFEDNSDCIVIENGDIVNRHLMDGDYVLFNRQPSLHKMSMMGHRVRVLSGNTFRLNVSVTPPYNADFDGDEMNMHVPQSYETMIELKEIMNVNKQIISPRENKPIITIVQDTLLGINKLTRNIDLKYLTGSSDKIITMNNTNSIYIKNTKAAEGKPKIKMVEGVYLNRKQMMNILCDLSTFGKKPFPVPEIEENVDGKNIKYYTGKQVFTFILPENLNLEMENGLCEDNKDKKNYVKIVEGILTQGGLDKGLFTKTSKGLIHTIFNDYGEIKQKILLMIYKK